MITLTPDSIDHTFLGVKIKVLGTVYKRGVRLAFWSDEAGAPREGEPRSSQMKSIVLKAPGVGFSLPGGPPVGPMSGGPS